MILNIHLLLPPNYRLFHFAAIFAAKVVLFYTVVAVAESKLQAEDSEGGHKPEGKEDKDTGLFLHKFEDKGCMLNFLKLDRFEILS